MEIGFQNRTGVGKCDKWQEPEVCDSGSHPAMHIREPGANGTKQSFRRRLGLEFHQSVCMQIRFDDDVYIQMFSYLTFFCFFTMPLVYPLIWPNLLSCAITVIQGRAERLLEPRMHTGVSVDC